MAFLEESCQILKFVIDRTERPVLGYDATFNIGNYYVSSLVLCIPFFVSDPVVAIAMVIHETKSFESHDVFFRNLKAAVPQLNKDTVTIVMDREKAFRRAVTNNFPKMNIVLCWNHFIADVKAKLYNLGATPDDRIVYLDHLHKLLTAEDLQMYMNNFEQLSKTWTESFKYYFIEHMQPDMLQYSSRWLIDIYDVKSGVTNISESFNNQLKSVIRPNMPSDLFVLSFYNLSAFGVWERIVDSMSLVDISSN